MPGKGAGMRDLGRAGKAPANDASSMRDYLQQFSSVPFLDGQLVQAKFLAGTQSQLVSHSLGRLVRGGFQVLTDGFLVCSVLTPRADPDPSKYVFLVCQTGPSVDTTVTVWVY